MRTNPKLLALAAFLFTCSLRALAGSAERNHHDDLVEVEVRLGDHVFRSVMAPRRDPSGRGWWLPSK